MKRIITLLCICGMLFSFAGCTDTADHDKRFEYTYLDVFDTVTVLQLYTENQEIADTLAEALHTRLTELHKAYTIYEQYDDITNLKTVNDRAGETVRVDDALFSLLELGKTAYSLTDGKVNMAMGSVLRLWRDARTVAMEDPENAQLPDMAVLKAAAEHTSIESVVLDAANKTVLFTDAEVSLDVGAFAKGYAVQQVADYAKELGITSALISVGGNVVAIGDKAGSPFIIGIQDPQDPSTHLLTVKASNCTVVTSGTYQRYFTVDGVQYHHLIDPDTVYPANRWASVSVIGPDSGVADILSTALFLLPQDQGADLLKTAGGYEAVWITSEGETLYSNNFENYLS